MKKFIKNNIVGFMIGIVLTAGIGVCAYTIKGNEVEYDNTTSGLEATNVQQAVDEINEKLASKMDIIPKGKILNTYAYWSFRIVDTPRSSSNAISFFAGSLIGRCDDISVIHSNSYGYLYYIKDGVNVNGNGENGTLLTDTVTIDKTKDYFVIVNTAYNNATVWFE